MQVLKTALIYSEITVSSQELTTLYTFWTNQKSRA